MDTSLAITKALLGSTDYSESQLKMAAGIVQQNTQRAEAREQIARSSDQPGVAIIFLDGWAARYQVLHDRSRQILSFLLSGDICADGLVIGKMCDAIVAITPVRYTNITKQNYVDLIDCLPNFAEIFWRSEALGHALQREWTTNIGRRNSKMRIAHLICELYARMEARDLDAAYDFPLTQADLADAVGLTPVHVNRVIQQLRSDGLIEMNRGRLLIRDSARLQSVAQFDPGYLTIDRAAIITRADALSIP